MKFIIAALSCVIFSSCMYLGMMRGGPGHQPGAESVIEKEVTAGGVRATAVFPPMSLEGVALITLRIVDAKTGYPISGARVSFHTEYLHKYEGHQTSGHSEMRNKADSIKTLRSELEHDINLDVDVNEGASPGMYTTEFKPSQPGEHRVMFHVQSVGDRKLEAEIIVGAERTVQEKMMGHGGGMPEMGGATSYVIIGAALMGAMMIVFWAGGRMF